MNYLNAKETAVRWQTSEQMVRRYCREGRVPDAIQKDGVWLIPDDVDRPEKKEPEKQNLPPMVKKLQKQKTKRVYHGLYDYVQINFCYSNNRMASNRLMRTQVEEIFKTGKVHVGFEPIKIDDLIEAYNHFACVNYIIETAMKPLTQTYIKHLYKVLTEGTVNVRKDTVHPGEYRKDPCTLGKTKTTPPKNINSQLSALLAEYEGTEEIELLQILDFHVRFERIHPFEDCNGRIGRLLMFKECLRHEIMPFILDDKRRTNYLQGLRNWDYDKSALFIPCQEAQQRFSAQIDLQELLRHGEQYKPADYQPER